MLHSVPSIKINTSFFSFCIPSHEFFFKSIIFSCYILSVKNKQGQFGKKINKKTTFIKWPWFESITKYCWKWH
jgi:hypothetical protein